MPFRCELAIARATLMGFLLLTLPLPSIAQQPAADPAQPPTLDQILIRVHENFDAYLSSLPNLFANEHLVSSMSARDLGGVGGTNLNSTTESIFRLQRSDPGEGHVRLSEARQIMSGRSSARSRETDSHWACRHLGGLRVRRQLSLAGAEALLRLQPSARPPAE